MAFALQKVSTLPATIEKNKVVNFPSMGVVKDKATPERHELPTKAREIANERLLFCREVYSLVFTGSCQQAAVDAVSTKAEAFPILAKAGRKNSSALNLYNYRSWMKRLGKNKADLPDWDNVFALADQYDLSIRGAKGAAEFWKVFNSFYLNPNKFSLSKAYNMAKDMCRAHNIAPIPSERQCRYWMETHADQAAVHIAREGETWAENHLISYIRRDWSALKPNDIWIGDHHIFDAPVRVWNEDKGKWQAERPWLTGWLDAKSLRFTGVHIGIDDPNSTKILTALQNGIRLNNNVAPKYLYNDNGKDYLKCGFTEDFIPKDTDSKHSIAAELGFKCINSLPYNAKAKTIERMFKEVCDGFSRTWAAYLGNRPDARPEVNKYFWDNPEELPSLGEFCEAFAKWLQECFHAKAQNGKILEGKSPAEVWTRGTGGMRFSDKDLWFALLLPYTTNCPKVRRGAAVKVDGEEYRSDGLWGFMSQKIMVKQDVVNGGAPQAFTLDGRHICALEPIATIPALATTEEERDMISDEMRRQRLEKKRAFAIAEDMTNGMYKVSAQDLALLKPGADVKLTKRTSKGKAVKAGGHKFEMLTIEKEKPNRELTAGEEKFEELQKFDEAIKQKEAEPEISEEKLAAFHKYMTSSEKRREHAYDGEEW